MYVDTQKVREMLYDDENFVNEFCDAAVESFREFEEQFEQHLLNRDEQPLRKTGHKIRPVAQMIGVDKLVEEYEHSKKLLHEERPDDELRESVQRVKNITDKVVEELNNIKKG